MHPITQRAGYETRGRVWPRIQTRWTGSTVTVRYECLARMADLKLARHAIQRMNPEERFGCRITENSDSGDL